jgi:hypothetical protein
MSGATRLGLALVGAAALLGLLADALLRETPLGLNVLLWMAAVALVAAVAVRLSGVDLGGGRAWLAVPLLLFAALLLWRDSPWLAALNLSAVGISAGLATIRVEGFRLWVAGVTDYVAGAGAALTSAGAGAATVLFGDIRWNEIPRGARSTQLGAAARGFAIALPLLAVFGGLFVAADAVFEQFLRSLAPADLETPAVHLLVIAAFAWPSLGLLRRLTLPPEEPVPFAEDRRRGFGLGAVEVSVAFALLDLLFLAFVLVQLRYLFGGDARVEAETGLTYAEYARQGFFELVLVAALVLPLLLVADWALRADRPRQEWVFRALAALLVVLLFVVMASALQRMRLYQRAYGLTELRVYATGFMVWLAAVVVWATATVLRGRRRLFAFGALVAGFSAIMALNVLNPDALIARTNLDHARSGAELDLRYLGELSDDAVPTLVAALGDVDPVLRRRLAANLLARRSDDDWRTWNVSRSRADDLLDERRAMLEALR